jgi:hypothetical protein
LKEPNYPEGSKLGAPGTPKLDHYNPDAPRKKVPLMGLQIMQDLQPSGGNLWANGKIYDRDNGKTYSSKAKLVSPTDLDLRGFGITGVALATFQDFPPQTVARSVSVASPNPRPSRNPSFSNSASVYPTVSNSIANVV